MMTDDTAADSPDDCMVAGVMSSRSTDDSALKASSSGGRACVSEQRDTQGNSGEIRDLHVCAADRLKEGQCIDLSFQQAG
jgi:hypothetical protein